MVPITRDDGYEARGATLADAPAILRVLHAAFAHWPPVELASSAADHLQWKLESPWISPNRHTVVTHDGVVVAVKVRWASPATLNGTAIMTDHGVDVAVLPDHQRHGLGRLMVEREAADQAHLGDLGFDTASNHEAIHRIHAGVQYVLHPIQTWERPLSVRASLVQGLRAGPRRLVSSLTRRAVTTPDLPADVSIEELDSFDERAGVLWSAVAPPYAFARIRDARYLNWRHADPRSGARTILAAVAGDQLLAWAALRPREGTLGITDLVIHPDHQATGIAFLEHCVRYAAERGASRIVTWLPAGHPAEAMHRAVGFTPQGEPFLCRFWGRTSRNVPFSFVEPLTPPAIAHVTMADFDFA